MAENRSCLEVAIMLIVAPALDILRVIIGVTIAHHFWFHPLFWR